MKKQRVPEFITSPRKDLSLWQSAVASTVHEQLRKKNAKIKRNSPEVFTHPMVMATNHFVSQINKGLKVERPTLLDFMGKTDEEIYNDHYIHGYLAQHSFENANKSPLIKNDEEGDGNTLPYSDKIISEWAITAAIYVVYFAESFRFPDPYISLSSIDPIDPCIAWEIPVPSNVLILGDWATGLEDALQFLQAAITKYTPSCIIHIGDVYYSGLSTECQANLNDILTAAYNNLEIAPIPFFSIPGNHEYIGGSYTSEDGDGIPMPTSGPGGGYFDVTLPFNNTINNTYPNSNLPAQNASFFQLQTTDNLWQFLGMDTGHNSESFGNYLPAFGDANANYGPSVNADEAQCLQKGIDGFHGNTILLSHHQLFSANAKINGAGAIKGGNEYRNDYLMSYFRSRFAKVSAWFWGHEHALGIFQDGLYGLPKGRLIGNSGYEERWDQDPYTVNNQLTPYHQPLITPNTTNVGTDNVPWYNHTCAVIQFNAPIDGVPTPPDVLYLDFPVWPSTTDTNSYPAPPLVLNTLFQESLNTVNPYFIGWESGLNCVSNMNNVTVWGNIVFASAKGTVFAFDNATGAQLGINQLNGETGELRLLVVNENDTNNLFVSSASGNVYCLSLDNTIDWKWTCPLGHADTTNLTFGNGYLYAGNHGNVLKIDLLTHSVIKKADVALSTNDGEVRLAYNGNYLYAGSIGDLVVFDPDTLDQKGDKNYIKESLYGVVSLIVLPNGNVVGGSSGYVVEFSADGQSIINNYDLGHGILTEVRFDTDGINVYAGAGDFVACLNNGSVVWSSHLIPSSSSSSADLTDNVNVIYSNGYVFAGCHGFLCQLDAASGSVLTYWNNQADYDDVPIALNGMGICAVFTDHIIVDGDYMNQTYVACVSQLTLT